MPPQFSVIMPLYNKAPYVHKALETVLAQTYRDFELIIVDDGSTDNSRQIVEQFEILDLRFQISSQENAGAAAARNNGVKASSGKFVCFLDADDWWEPTFLEEINRLITEYPDAGVYCTNYVYYKPCKTHVPLNLPTGYMNYPDAYLRSTAMPIWTGATCMPRTVFDEMGGFPVGIKLGEDFLLWAKTALHYPIAFCEKPLAYYNNDVPASLRATRNLHKPEHHMLFHLDAIEDEIKNLKPKTINLKSAAWTQLLDKLRVSGLLNYWLSDEYHDMAAAELRKVDWSKQPKFAIRLYKTPIWLLRAKQSFMQMGSSVKQRLIKSYFDAHRGRNIKCC